MINKAIKLKKTDTAFITSINFWSIVLLGIIIVSAISSISLLFGVITFVLICISPFFWKVVANQKLTLILILLSILPGMLGRFATAPKGGTTLLLTDLLVVLLIFGFSLSKIFYDKKWRITPLHFYISGFFLIAFISYFNGIFHLNNLGTIELKELIVSFMYLLRWIGYAVIFFFLCNNIKKEKDIKSWFNILMWIVFITAILGFLQLIFYPDFFEMFVLYGWDPHKDRLLGTFFDPNLIGAFLAMNVSVLLGLILFIKKDRKWLILLAITLFVALALTLSRSAYLGVVGSFLFISIYKSRTLLVSGIIVIIIGLALNPTVFDRISQGVAVDDSATKHIESWMDGVNLIQSYPLLGVGYNMLPSVYDDLALTDEWDINNKSGIENSLFTVWVTSGILGVISFLLIWIMVFVHAFKNSKRKKLPLFLRGLNFGIAGGLVAVFLSSIFVNTLFFSYIVVYLWFFAAFVMMSTLISNIETKSSSLTKSKILS